MAPEARCCAAAVMVSGWKGIAEEEVTGRPQGSPPIEQVDLWATVRAGVGLGMKTPVQGIVILRLASGTHWEDTHGCLVAVIGNILDDCEARTTIGAVNERMTITPVYGVEEFMQTVVTGGGIWRDECIALGSSLAMGDCEGCIIERWYHFGKNRVDPCQGWDFLAQSALKAIKRLEGSFDLDGYTVAVIQHKTGQTPA